MKRIYQVAGLALALLVTSWLLVASPEGPVTGMDVWRGLMSAATGLAGIALAIVTFIAWMEDGR